MSAVASASSRTSIPRRSCRPARPSQRRPVKWIESRREHLRTASMRASSGTPCSSAFRARRNHARHARGRAVGPGCVHPQPGRPVPSLTAAGLPGPYRFHDYLLSRPCRADQQGARARRIAALASPRPCSPPSGSSIAPPSSWTRSGGVRRKNFIRPDDFPWDVGTIRADARDLRHGEYAAGLDRALELGDYQARREQASERAKPDGRWLGIGLAAYVMLSGLGPHEGSVLRVDPTAIWRWLPALRPTARAQRRRWRRSSPTSSASARPTSASAMATPTPFPSASAPTPAATQSWPATPHRRRHTGARTRRCSWRRGSSRPRLRTSSSSTAACRCAACRRAADARPARRGRGAGGRCPTGLSPDWRAPLLPGAAGHVCQRRPPGRDRDRPRHASQVRILDYAAVSDAGPLINPMIVQGQIVGGVAQGLGGALFEELTYDENGQLLARRYSTTACRRRARCLTCASPTCTRGRR